MFWEVCAGGGDVTSFKAIKSPVLKYFYQCLYFVLHRLVEVYNSVSVPGLCERTNTMNKSWCIVVKIISLRGRKDYHTSLDHPHTTTIGLTNNNYLKIFLRSHLTRLQLVQRLQPGDGGLLRGFELPGLRGGSRLRAARIFSVGRLPPVVFVLRGRVRGREYPASKFRRSLPFPRTSPLARGSEFHWRFRLFRLTLRLLVLRLYGWPLLSSLYLYIRVVPGHALLQEAEDGPHVTGQSLLQTHQLPSNRKLSLGSRLLLILSALDWSYYEGNPWQNIALCSSAFFR